MKRLEGSLEAALFRSNVQRLRDFACSLRQQLGSCALDSALADVLLPR